MFNVTGSSRRAGTAGTWPDWKGLYFFYAIKALQLEDHFHSWAMRLLEQWPGVLLPECMGIFMMSKFEVRRTALSHE